MKPVLYKLRINKETLLDSINENLCINMEFIKFNDITLDTFYDEITREQFHIK